MWCIAVTTPFTREALHRQRLLDEIWIVDDPSTLLAVVQRMIVDRAQDTARAQSARGA